MTSNIYTIFSNILLLNRDCFENTNRQILVSYLLENRLEEYLEVFVCPENRADMRMLIFFLDRYLPMWRDVSYGGTSYLHIKDDQYRDMQYIYYGIVNLEVHASKIQGVELTNERYVREKESLHNEDVIDFCRDFNINDDLSVIPLGGFERDMRSKTKLVNKCVILSFYFDAMVQLKYLVEHLNKETFACRSEYFKEMYPKIEKIIDSRIFQSEKNLFSLICMNSYLKEMNVNLEDLIRLYYDILPIYKEYKGNDENLGVLLLH